MRSSIWVQGRVSQKDAVEGGKDGMRQRRRSERFKKGERFNPQFLALKIQEGCHEPRNAWSL